MSTQFRAIGSNAGNLVTPTYYPCNQTKAVPVIVRSSNGGSARTPDTPADAPHPPPHARHGGVPQHFHGTDDRLVPYNGAQDSVEYVADNLLSCTEGPVVRPCARTGDLQAKQ